MAFVCLKRVFVLFLYILICMPLVNCSEIFANEIFRNGTDQNSNGSDSAGMETGSVTLTWTKPDDSRVTGYNLYCGKLGSDFKSMSYASIYSVENTSYNFSGLETGCEYSFAITSFDSQGNESAFSETINHFVVSLLDNDNDGDGYTENGGDCDDSMGSIHPGAAEICGDGTDQDCDGSDLACQPDPAPYDIDNDVQEQLFYPAINPPKEVRETIDTVSMFQASASGAPAIEWTYHKTPDNLHPDAMEQQMVWLMNRARANPNNEGIWLATSIDPRIANGRDFFSVDTTVLQNEFAAYLSKPPAAFDVRLYNAAKAHSEDLIARDAQDHTGQDAEIAASGFTFSIFRGNVFSYADDGVNAHAAFNIDWGNGTADGMQTGRGHRQAIMSLDGDYTNVGIASVSESNPSTSVGPEVVTQNFCFANPSESNHYNRFIVGTVWEDLNTNSMYDPGEGKSGVTVMPDSGDYFAVTSDSGGYAIPVNASTIYQVSFSGTSVPGWTSSVSVNGSSVLLDYVVAESLLVLSVSPANRDVPKESGSTTFSVSNTGTGTMPWTAAVISGGSWLSITSGASGSNSGTINCAFDANTSTSARTGIIRVTADGSTGSPEDVMVIQAGNQAVTLTGLGIIGPASVNENSITSYTATANWSDGSTSTVEPLWSEDSAYASISVSGLLTAVEVSDNLVVTVSASFTSGDVTESATKSVTIVNEELTEGDSIALFDPDASSFYLKNSLSGGPADAQFRFGPRYSGWTPVAGDWNGNSQATIGLFDPEQSRFYLKNTNTGGNADAVFDFGPNYMNWLPIAGDWDGDGHCSIGLYDPLNSTFYLKNSLSGGNADHTFRFGSSNSGWQPIAGDWDGDGMDSIGLYSSQTGQFYLKNSLSGGAADESLRFGPKASTWIAVCGDWDGDGVDGIGLLNPTISSFYLKNSFAGGSADIEFGFGPDGMGWTPLAGSW